jgi:regulator of RNase E activity RraA
VLADVDGAVVVPRRAAEKVLIEAERLTRKEVVIRRELDRGANLEDVLERHGHV